MQKYNNIINISNSFENNDNNNIRYIYNNIEDENIKDITDDKNVFHTKQSIIKGSARSRKVGSAANQDKIIDGDILQSKK
jgi:hypothetical protein